MDLSPPRPKKYCRLPHSEPLPLIPEGNSFHKFNGVFNGFSIVINDRQEMKQLISMGYFGKATLSRSYPQFEGTFDKPAIVRKRQYSRRKIWNEKFDTKQIEKIIVVPDSENEDEYFENLLAHYEVDKCGHKESVNMMLEEAFFLQDALECLQISYKNEIANSSKLWNMFCDSDCSFHRKYPVYYYFRSKNWVVKPGIKFGGDYLLYKEGPPFYHASYVVLIKENNEEFDSTSLMGLQRMCETSGKELMICLITLPENGVNKDNLHDVEIEEILMKRWISSQEREENT